MVNRMHRRRKLGIGPGRRSISKCVMETLKSDAPQPRSLGMLLSNRRVLPPQAPQTHHGLAVRFAEGSEEISRLFLNWAVTGGNRATEKRVAIGIKTKDK